MPIVFAPLNVPVRVVKMYVDEKTKRRLESLGISVNTVKVQKNRAKIQLRARLKDLYPLLLLFLKMV